MAANLPIHIRQARYGDLHFCADAWLKSTRYVGTNVRVPDTVYYGLRRPIVHALLSKYDVHIAAWDEDDAQIYGFLCAQECHKSKIVYYLYVKSPFRGMGIARRLCEAAGIDDKTPVLFAEITRMSPSVKEKHDFVHAPDLCFYGAHGNTEHTDVIGVCDYAHGQVTRKARDAVVREQRRDNADTQGAVRVHWDERRDGVRSARSVCGTGADK